MSVWVPERFANAIVAAVRKGEKPRVAVRQLVQWFGFERRGSKVNGYILEAMRAHGIVCTPSLEGAFPEQELVFSSLVPSQGRGPTAVDEDDVKTTKRQRADLPYPFAHFDAMVAVQSSEIKRVKTLLDAMERAMAYLVYCQLAALSERSGGTRSESVRKVVAAHLSPDASSGPPVSFGTWVEFARRLAMESGLDPHPVLAVGREVFGGTSSVGRMVERTAVPWRNKLAHAAGIPAATYAEAEPVLIFVDRGLRKALQPLLACELVCVKTTEVGEREAYRYRLRSLHGANRFFATRTLETSQKLVTGWAHLLCGDFPILRLAPGIYCVEDEASEEVELFFCSSLAIDPNRKVSLRAVSGTNERREITPADCSVAFNSVPGPGSQSLPAAKPKDQPQAVEDLAASHFLQAMREDKLRDD